MSLQPLYVLTGTEPLLQTMFIQDLRTKVFPEGPQGFNDDQLDGKAHTWAEIFDLANTFPMFAQRRMITVRNVADFKADDEELWTKYLENPPLHTVLVLQAEKLDKRKKVTKHLEKSGFLHDLIPPKPNMMAGWVDKLADLKKLKVEPKARMTLVDSIGTNLSKLNQELDKLELFVHPSRVITDQAVSELVLKSAGDTIFAFTDDLMEGQTGKCFQTLEFLMGDGTPALVVLSMIARHVKILIRAKEALKKPGAGASLAQVLKVPPFLVSKYSDQAKRHSVKKLLDTISLLCDLDFDFKSTGLSERHLLERFILKMNAK